MTTYELSYGGEVQVSREDDTIHMLVGVVLGQCFGLHCSHSPCGHSVLRDIDHSWSRGGGKETTRESEGGRERAGREHT